MAKRHVETLAMAAEPGDTIDGAKPKRPPLKCSTCGQLPANGKHKHELDMMWGRLLAVTEAERRRVEHHIAEQSGAEVAIMTLANIASALRAGDVETAREIAAAWERKDRTRLMKPRTAARLLRALDEPGGTGHIDDLALGPDSDELERLV